MHWLSVTITILLLEMTVKFRIRLDILTKSHVATLCVTNVAYCVWQISVRRVLFLYSDEISFVGG